MGRKILNQNLNNAKSSKKDEFYTQLSDIEKEVRHYKPYFKDKVVLCNCDDPRISNFFHYFSYNFEQLGLKKLIATCYKNKNAELFTDNQCEEAIYLEYTGDKNGDNIPNPEEIGVISLKGDGDFRSQECIELLKQADIIVTNPPFSLFREYITQLMKYNKSFLILGHQNAIIYKEVFKFIKDNKIWLGINNGGTKWFEVKDHYDITTESRKKIENGKKYFSMGSVVWYTNMETAKRHEDLILYKRYSEKEYPKYDNYDAIDVSKVSDIPVDYEGIMGVPITFLDKYNPDQFEIVGSNRGIDQDPNGIYGRGSYLNGKETFKRLFIRNKKVQKNEN
ncbi:adenine-specific methyltransferase EcoRI family protein [Alistipes indistinctus]|uniref:Modification methylase EcoRI n=1 Tax=Alistipes indistinctus YIT 12060 TaxID=742725 RepID=G5HBD1_9BACT|nr:adenine-specific methyltransferase EcoRI family protein [Alistipes indistinctus]EHB91897.1 hypothetical protein HMPREF9450_01946 [Alistipes indistinctus YIT 12060]UWN59653.1 adenine-specific methyltransferase EcoRI family protein [Alistipes indistinctus YIT 12060]